MIKNSTSPSDLKLTGYDHDHQLQFLWKSDETRPWDIYSKERFTKFWDVRVDFVEHRA